MKPSNSWNNMTCCGVLVILGALGIMSLSPLEYLCDQRGSAAHTFETIGPYFVTLVYVVSDREYT